MSGCSALAGLDSDELVLESPLERVRRFARAAAPLRAPKRSRSSAAR
jgi:hypothetical protein